MPSRPSTRRPVPPALPPLLLARDHAPAAVRRAVAAGRWVRVGRGAYLAADIAADARGLALGRIAAVHERVRQPHWFSHESAALLRGLPTWRPPVRTHLVQRHRGCGEHDPTVVRHAARLAPDECEAVHGLPVTTLARTVVDCARALPALQALVVADAALRAGCSPQALADALRRCEGQRGSRRARDVLALADAGAESAGETWVRVVLLAAGVPAPVTQLRVETRRGPVWADLGWPGARLLLEYDGRGKYATPEDLYREKQRQDALVEAGWTVLRVTADDCRRPQELVARVVRAAPELRPAVRGRRLPVA